eukprot:gene24926-30114_t
MPLDITLFRKEGGNPEAIRESQRRRFQPVESVDEIIAKDDEWRLITGNIDKMRKARNLVQKDIAEVKKAVAKAAKEGKTAEEVAALDQESVALLQRKEQCDKDIEAAELTQKTLREEIDKKINKIGNLVHLEVPISQDEDNNRVERTWGTPRDPAGLLNHHDLLWRIGGYEPERGAAVAGHRGYFLKDALINFGITFLRARGYGVLQPPYFMKRDVMAGVAQLEQFDEELYKVTGEGGEEKYLIATSEQPICAYHKDEWMEEKALPLRYAGISTCFRKEAGSHGKDTWGIFRVHQFEKVEQFMITKGDIDESNLAQEEMIKTAEEFYQTLGLPYRVINIVSGALNNAAIRKFDLEAWFPGYNNFRELKLNEREKKYVHMLNATLCATGRALCCILENYQTEGGVRVPDALIPFMGGLTFLPFVRDVPAAVGAPAAAAPEKKKEDKKKSAEAPKEAPKKKEEGTSAAPAPAPAPAPAQNKKEEGTKATPPPPPAYTTPAPTRSSQEGLGGI